MNKTPLVILSFLCLFVFGLAACSASDSNNVEYAVPEETLITVNGQKITNKDIDRQMNALKTQYHLNTDDQWKQFLIDQKMSESDLTKQIEDKLINLELIKDEAEKEKITVDEKELDKQIEHIKSNYPNQSAWHNALVASGYTEQSYRDAVKVSILSQKLHEKIADNITPTEEEKHQFCESVASNFSGRKSSHILFNINDLETAQKVLQKINDGEDFADLAKQYSLDGSATNGGDVGWDFMSSFVPEYQNALNDLSKGRVSPIIKSQFGYHIIKCTDTFNLDKNEKIAYEDIPQDILDSIMDLMHKQLSAQKFSAYLDELKQNADIKYVNSKKSGEETKQ